MIYSNEVWISECFRGMTNVSKEYTLHTYTLYDYDSYHCSHAHILGPHIEAI